ncbi:ABC transporter ATP-binding protein [Actinopolymorpha singaporensis]|uniref:Peptide/nickel transport system ATP-binding protein n=1 Tax=Actinopolymorpha singaporensis TaxID=117157 RepID=A0A1H1V9M4_9ACTN|nr:ATP-binding cassette domain-containing protein [Actinopolymorpha singaporensis]SDS81211.1 peptide/nickel transport system ATP-binding protein [Actinopolymorpha singaporensis]
MADEATSGPLLELDRITQVFSTRRGEVRAVDDVTLRLGVGEVMCLVGQSGSGKSTTAKIASGLLRPSEGVVRFEGEDILGQRRPDKSRFKRFRRAVQYVHQDPYASLNPIQDVYSTLSAPLRRHGLVKNRSQARERVAELLAQVGLTPPETFMPKFPHQMSGGQRQRVAVARALTLEPRLIIADEATSMLDVSIRIGLLGMLTKLRTELGVGFMFITHDLAMAKYFGAEGDIAVMHEGKIVEYGPTLRVIGDPQDAYTQALLEAVPEADPDLARRKRAARTAAKAANADGAPASGAPAA